MTVMNITNIEGVRWFPPPQSIWGRWLKPLCLLPHFDFL